MYVEAIQHLCCPHHPTKILALLARATITADGDIIHGTLRCPICHRRYTIRNGIADLLGWNAIPTSVAHLTNVIPITAWGYERLWRHRALTLLSGEPFGYERELPLITGLLDPILPGIYLDIACSNGLYARSIAAICTKHGGHVIALDHAMPMLQEARRIAQREHLRISYICASAQSLPFAPQSIVGAAMGGSLNEIGDADRALRELQRVLIPRGRFVMMSLIKTEHRLGGIVQEFLKSGGITFWSQQSVNEHLAAAELTLKAQWCYGIVLFSLATAHTKA